MARNRWIIPPNVAKKSQNILFLIVMNCACIITGGSFPQLWQKRTLFLKCCELYLCHDFNFFASEILKNLFYPQSKAMDVAAGEVGAEKKVKLILRTILKLL